MQVMKHSEMRNARGGFWLALFGLLGAAGTVAKVGSHFCQRDSQPCKGKGKTTNKGPGVRRGNTRGRAGWGHSPHQGPRRGG